MHTIKPDFQKVADHVLLREYTPAGVIIDGNMDVVYFHGNTAPYLEQAPGKPTHNIFQMANKELASQLHIILDNGIGTAKQFITGPFTLQEKDKLHTVSVEVVPLPDLTRLHYLVLFHNYGLESPESEPDSKAGKYKKELRILQLEKTLAQCRENMRFIIQKHDAVNAAFQNTNEELVSTGEELQTLNEELETSGEELQSSNEQLVVVNHELQDLNAQVQKLLTKFQNLTMQAPVAICIYRGRDFVVEIANDFYLQMVEKDQDFIGKPLFESLPEGKAQGIKTMLDHVLDTGMPFHGTEVELNFPRDKKGAKGFFNFICQPIREKDNSINSIMVVVNEVTDQVIARNKNSEIQQLHARELEEKVRQRTQELLESNEELIKANLELESFTYISSHDLQEPLRKIQTFSKLILEKEHAALSDSGKDYFKRMQSAAARMQQLITDLLAFSHVNSAERNFEKTDLRTIIEEVKNDLNEIIEEKQAIVDTGEPCEGVVIAFQFRQLMQNLLGNALKFSSPDRQPHILIKSEIVKGSVLKHAMFENNNYFSPEKNYCHISVADNGIGFDIAYKNRIFELFQRLHAKDAYSGTGIGLSIVKKIVENHKGFITAASTLGHGTCFDIYLPA